MQTEEQKLIDGLFTRLKEAENQTATRDSQAEQLIQARLREQPAAPYYMAQVILIQEAALKRLDQRIKELEAQVASLQQSRPSSGGFLSSLFGGGDQQPSHKTSVATPSRSGWNEPGPRQGNQQNYGQGNPAGWGNNAAAAPSRSGGFLAGAMQTAVGVAGGMLLADTISGLFHDSSPEEIVQVINEEPAPAVADTGAAEPDQGAWADSGMDDNYGSDDFQQADSGGDDGGFFDSDDDSFV
ncbi:DUF2076 domain-containing protein [Azomonas macrocytogenes]|uniref:Periplasmic ligand-binding sensor protein n=1 Tax=Azomonas macrocytogenes TaxID=69962 RepID=A0A839T6X6_AZOMA|nr:DUF2076 domain-containing protein [Azomonas macrocytogenes]MBB3104829.1 hypothetical protein [Azomonas macrocytogenes]